MRILKAAIEKFFKGLVTFSEGSKKNWDTGFQSFWLDDFNWHKINFCFNFTVPLKIYHETNQKIIYLTSTLITYLNSIFLVFVNDYFIYFKIVKDSNRKSSTECTNFQWVSSLLIARVKYSDLRQLFWFRIW